MPTSSIKKGNLKNKTGAKTMLYRKGGIGMLSTLAMIIAGQSGRDIFAQDSLKEKYDDKNRKCKICGNDFYANRDKHDLCDECFSLNKKRRK